LLVISTENDGIFLVRYAPDGEFAGDTWHQTIDEAKRQATFEYGELVGPWTAIPSDVQDIASFMNRPS